jgi:SH3 domain-containing YSC84-like protein 1
MKINGSSAWKIFSRFLGFLMLAALPLVMVSTAHATDNAEAQAIVDKAKGTLANFMSDGNYSWLHSHLKTAYGVIIFPQIIKAGFFLGGTGGSGVLLVRDAKTGTWSEPAFYTLGSVTFGLQIGGEAAEVIMLAMNRSAVESLYSSSIKLGGNASIALGPVGGGATGEVTADFVSFAKSKGLYAGINLEGSYIGVRDSLNEAFYGKSVRPVDIIVRKEVKNSGADELRSALKNASSTKQ